MEGSSDNVKMSSGSNPPEDPTTCATTPIALDWPTRARRPTVKQNYYEEAQLNYKLFDYAIKLLLEEGRLDARGQRRGG